MIEELLIYKAYLYPYSMHESKDNIKSISLSPGAMESSLCTGLKQSINTQSLVPKSGLKKCFLLWSSQNLRIVPFRIKVYMYVSVAFVFKCVVLSAFLSLCKKPSDTKCHPKARALLLFSFYHRTLLALATLLTCDRSFFQKHLIAFQTAVTPTRTSETPTQRYTHAAVSCPNTVYPLASSPAPS